MCNSSEPKAIANASPILRLMSISDKTITGLPQEPWASGVSEVKEKMEVTSCHEPPVEISLWYPAITIIPSYWSIARPQYDPSDNFNGFINDCLGVVSPLAEIAFIAKSVYV